MFIALCQCEKIGHQIKSTKIHLKFNGVAYGKSIKKIIGELNPNNGDLNFFLGREYVVYLEFFKIQRNILYGKILYYQNLENIHLKAI
ncbi:MAG: hypothetical protein HN576_02245 [Bacteriovoracaceae bacterium]|nr:hypothetical protein [Bacteriovoracaceae bacterium]